MFRGNCVTSSLRFPLKPPPAIPRTRRPKDPTSGTTLGAPDKRQAIVVGHRQQVAVAPLMRGNK